MSRERLVLVISDLHIGAGSVDDFDADIERHFVAFVDQCRGEERPVELVINGDFLDFVQAPPLGGANLEGRTRDGVPLCFTEQQSLQKLDAIVRHHEPAFDAVRSFLTARRDTRLTILPGNHDADLYWPRVRRTLIQLLCGRDSSAAARLTFQLDPVYRPPGHEHLWIEHGHQADAINAFVIDKQPCWSKATPPIRHASSGERRLFECIGTRFLIRYLNSLDAAYPLVDNVKPFSRFVRIFGASALVPGHGPLKVAVAVAAMLRYLAVTLGRRPSDLLEDADEQPWDYDAVLRHAIQSATPEELEAFSSALAAAGFRRTNPLIMSDDPRTLAKLADFAAEHPEILDAFPDSEAEGVLALGQGFAADETDDLRQAAERILDDPVHGCHVVTMGHTHEHQDGDRYFNTGSWTRYYKYEPEEPLRPWSILREGSYAEFPYALHVLRSETGPARHVTLERFAVRERDDA